MIKKSEVLAACKADMKAAEIKKKTLDGKIQIYKKEHNGEPYGNEVKGRSQIVSRDIKKQDEWQHASIKEPFVSTPDIIKCSPVTFEDKPAAEQNELVLNTQFCRQFDRYNFMTKALKVLSREGTLVVMTGWDYEESEEMVEVPIIGINPITNEQVQMGTRKEKQLVVKKNQPTAKVCRNEDIFMDPTCMDNVDEAQFFVHRYETNLSALKSDGRYKNLDKINLSSAEATNNGDNYYPEDPTYFRFRDDPRKKIIVHEYWGNYDVNEDGIAEPIVCVWVNDTIIRMESNPYPDGKPPFIVVPFSSVPFQMQGEAPAELLSDTQKVKTAILRGVIDNMAQSTNGQKGIKKGALDVVNRRKFLNGENFEFNNSPTDFYDGSYNQIPSSAFDMFTLMNNEAESMTGTKAFGAVGNSSMSATASKGALDATAVRRMDIVRNVSENLVKPLLRKWMVYNSEFLDEKQVMRITNEKFVEIKRDDLDGDIDIDIAVSTAEDNASKAQELSFMLQTTAQGMDPALHNIILGEIARLQKMPDLAKKIETYQPQPDPIQQQMQQLQLQMLQAQLVNEQAKGADHQVDAQLKAAKAATEQAKARAMHSESDMIDLDFLEKESGADKQHEMNMQQNQLDANHASAMDQSMLQHQNEMQKADINHRSKMDQIAMNSMHKEHMGAKDRELKQGLASKGVRGS
jgi:hypothetical protein